MDSSPNTVNVIAVPCSATKLVGASEIDDATRERERYNAVIELSITRTRIAAATTFREACKARVNRDALIVERRYLEFTVVETAICHYINPTWTEMGLISGLDRIRSSRNLWPSNFGLGAKEVRQRSRNARKLLHPHTFSYRDAATALFPTTMHSANTSEHPPPSILESSRLVLD